MLFVSIQKKLSHFQLQAAFQIKSETVILFGPSGSGKTTILNCIAGLTDPDTGEISLDDTILFKSKKNKLPIQKRQVGYVFQDYALFPHMTVRKNIEYGAYDSLVTQQLLNLLRIHHLADKYPRQISGGEKQRVALARALATKPGVLLLDEPFSSLDEETKNECYHHLNRLKKEWKIPILLVTHDKQEAKKLGDRILSIREGKLKSLPPEAF
ncbi:ATP-binding cassette domain-containing protein [Halobacillus campisalis]|uniref:ATP-binding cassette domain-containing protein n=1 Tax=Halobacillus campisalis TaxID=435909 RepID=A0ABW2K1T8_9BACI|nr:ATP-binding cassette domain-containing protein [Halobacillus campisalis]